MLSSLFGLSREPHRFIRASTGCQKPVAESTLYRGTLLHCVLRESATGRSLSRCRLVRTPERFQIPCHASTGGNKTPLATHLPGVEYRRERLHCTSGAGKLVKGATLKRISRRAAWHVLDSKTPDQCRAACILASFISGQHLLLSGGGPA